MKLEDKKVLADELMGWYIGPEFGKGKIGPGKGRCWFYRGDPIDFTEMIDSRKYNPDIDPRQFIQVLKKLTFEEGIEVIHKLRIKHESEISGNLHWFYGYTWISDHMPEVIDIVIELKRN